MANCTKVILNLCDLCPLCTRGANLNLRKNKCKSGMSHHLLLTTCVLDLYLKTFIIFARNPKYIVVPNQRLKPGPLGNFQILT